MSDLPQLPERVRRKLALQWDALVEQHGFTGEHLNWPQTRRRKIVTGANRPPTSFDSRTAHFIQERTGSAGAVYAHADTIGVDETGLLATERYIQLVGEYFALWLAEQGRRSEVFTAWLVELRAVVADEIAELWKERGDWFQRMCRPRLDTRLTPVFNQWRSSARDVEINDLAPENIAFERLMARGREAIERSATLLAQEERTKAKPEEPPNAPPAPHEVLPEPAAPRFSGTVTSRDAVNRMDAFMNDKGLGLTEFACQSGTTDRTLRSFRKTAKVRRDIFDGIAKAMGVSRQELLHGKATGK